MEAEDPLWQEFAAETAEHLDALEQGLSGEGRVDVLFRAMHSLKGMSAAIGATGMGGLAHRAEDVLGQVRAGQRALDAPTRRLLLAAVDRLRAQRAALLERRQDLPPPAALLAELSALADGRASDADAAAAPPLAPRAGDPLRLSLASRLQEELPAVLQAPARALPLAEAARAAGLPRLAALLEAVARAEAPLPAFGRLRVALRLLEEATGQPAGAGLSLPGAPDPAPLAAALEAAPAALAEAAEDFAASGEALGDAGAAALGWQILDLARRGPLAPAQRAAFAEALRARPLAPLGERLAPPPPPLTARLAAALPPAAHARAAAALAEGRRIWRLRLGPLPGAEAQAEPFLARAGEVLGSAGPPEALDLFLASDLPPEEIAALRAEADPDGAALLELAPADAPPPAPTMRVRQDRIDAVIALEAELRAAALALGEALAAPEARAALEELAALQRRLPAGTAARLAGALERLRAAQGAAERAGGRLSIALGQLDEAVLALRVVPFSSLALRLPRALRATAEAEGKQVQLLVRGEEVQLDRGLAELLADPLLHLIRNAVDHGVERPEERRALGKPATATVTLSAERHPGRLVVSLADDGRGIEEERVLARAVALGLVAAEAAARLSPAEIHALLFLPGFSTREAVSETSGRGVGLDVVQEAARRAGGSLRVESRRGAGARFVLDLPLTAAIQPVLLVEAGGHPYALPASRVESVLRPGEAHGARSEASLEALLHLPPAEAQAVVVLARPSGALALAVHRLGRRTDLLLKPLHPALAGTPGVGGVGVLGNGEPVLLLEPDGLGV
ncbi:ATP-binding protein [Rubritepida flocculans]|uniref:ATP-binding protein n=1 Tax=Rubritepida flocculans TaxID=182403 RepID=UPI0004086C55|nr:ATP-binding protein [Rubritepida flocculans]